MSTTHHSLPKSDEIAAWAYAISANVIKSQRWSLRSYLSNKRAKRVSRSLGLACKGHIPHSGLNAVRLFIAGGMNYWLGNLKERTPEELVMYMFWPIVVAPKLPRDWFECLQNISSPPLAQYVKNARDRVKEDGALYYVLSSWSDLTPPVYKVGLKNLLDDMRDPARGGAVLQAIRLCAGIPTPNPEPNSSVTLFKWLVGAGVAGVVGNRLDDSTKDLWVQLFTSIYNPSSPALAAGASSGNIAGDLPSEGNDGDSDLLDSIFN